MRFNRFFLLISFQLFFCLLASAQSRLTNLPTLYINTVNNTSIDSKDAYIDASLSSVSPNSAESFTEANIRIRGRGNSTWRMPKKSYRIKFANKLHFLNLPAKEDDWVLLANYADKTMIRNALAFELSKQLGMEFTPSVKFVDLVLNGQYMGTYQVTDQVEVKNDRVPLEKQDASMISLPDISGGYLLEADGFADGDEKFKTDKGLNIVIKYPDEEDINASQRNYITSYTQEFENALFSLNFKDEDIGYRKYVDVPTLINWYIIVELTGNPDGFWSTYFYKKRNDPKFKFGPVWDFDIAFNNDERLGDATRKLMKDAAHNPKQWIRRLLEDPKLENEIAKRWEELKEQGILEHLLDYLDLMAQELNSSQKLNFQRWDILNKEVYLELEARGTYEAELAFLRNYIKSRYEFLDSQWKVKVPTEEVELLAQSNTKRVLVPKTNIGTSWRSELGFNDSQWKELQGYPAGVGYEKTSGYESLITLDLANDMHRDGTNPNSSVYIRIPFSLQAADLEKFSLLKLHIFYDDGFIAYLNGVNVYQVNAPLSPAWNSEATGQHEAQSEDIIDLSDKLSLLKEGENLLAIHGLNAGTGSSDFIISLRLNAHKPIGVEEEPDEEDPGDGDGDGDGSEDEDPDVVTGIDAQGRSEDARIYPNPVLREAKLSFSLSQPSKLKLFIYDQRGVVVLQQQLQGTEGKNEITVLVKELNIRPGLYALRLISDTKTILSEKVVVKGN